MSDMIASAYFFNKCRSEFYGKPNSSQRAATLSISALLTLLTGGNFASLNFIVASIPMPRLGGFDSMKKTSRLQQF
jgi:hypothetical protein